MLTAVQRWADDELRSLNAQIEYLLRDALLLLLHGLGLGGEAGRDLF